MSISQPCLPTYASQQENEPEPLNKFVNNWKQKSRANSQYDRIKRLLFHSNRRPTEFKPSDFFPQIPDSELASESEEQTIEKTGDSLRKSLSKRKLDYDKFETTEHAVENEKQRRQSVALNETTNHSNSLSPISSPSKTTRTVLKLRRDSLVQQIQKDDEKKLSSTINNSQSPLTSNTPAKQAFNDSIRRQSCNLSLMANNIEKMNEAPLSNENDEIIDGSKELVSDLNRADDDQEDIFKAPTPIKSKTPDPKSSITITKRRSNEPIREIPVEILSSATLKILSRTKSITKINQSINDDPTEMQTAQTNKFIKRSSLSKTINNSTVNSSSASVLFQPVKASRNLPPPPLFNKSDSDYDDTVREIAKVKNKKKVKKATKAVKTKSVNKSTENPIGKEMSVEPELVVEAVPVPAPIPVSVEQVDDVGPPSPSPVQPEPLEVSQNVKTRADRSKITSFLSKTVDKDKEQVAQKDKENITPKKSKTKKSKNKPETIKKKPLKEKQNEAKISKPAKESRKDEGFFANNKTVPFNRDENNVEKDDDNLPLTLRRSKRAKLDKYSQPVYAYETIEDYKGNKCVVQTLIGTKEKIDVKIKQELRKINHLLSPPTKTKSKSKQKKKDANLQDIRQVFEKKAKKKNNKKVQSENEEESETREKSLDLNNNDDNTEPAQPVNVDAQPVEQVHNDVDEVEPRAPIEMQPLPSDRTLSVSGLNLDNCLNNSQVNKSQEVVYLNREADQEAEALHIFFYHKNIDKRLYEYCSPGVGICPISSNTGLIRIDKHQSTRTSKHGTSITYFVQRGNCIFSINGTVSLHTEKDVIVIPTNQSYKIKDCSENVSDNTYLYFRFDKE